MIKLKRMKVVLRDWNKRTFGRTDCQIADLEVRIEGLETSLQESYSVEIEDDLVASKIELSM